jgi:hypothetical protein
MKPNLNDQDAFLVSQLLDGDLSEAQAAELQSRIEREPALREAYDSLSQLNGLLVEHGSREPDVDFSAFRSQVMTDIAAESASEESTTDARVLKFPSWLKVAGPLAAAAAIALVVWLQPAVPGGDDVRDTTGPFAVSPPPADTSKTAAPPAQPLYKQLASAKQAGRIQVAVARPSMASRTVEVSATVSTSVQVSFARNETLAKQVRSEDIEQRSRPTRHVFFASAPRSQVTQPVDPFAAFLGDAM